MPNQTITITCPLCQKLFSLDQALTHQIESDIKHSYEEELKQEKVRLWKLAQEKALEKIKGETNAEMKLLQEELEENKRKLEETQKAELELRRIRNQLEEEKRTFELTKQRQLDEERMKIKEEVAKILSEEHQLKDAEKDKRITDMLKTIEDLKRKAEQSSQQLQGEVLELELEELLKAEFPYDEIVPVSKGIHGADILQKVHDKQGRYCGSITWESKRTKAWSDGWVQKLKDDQRSAKAEVAVLVSQVLPKDMKYFGPKDGIYVCDYQSLLGLAKLLRGTLIQLALTKTANIGKNEKMEVIWNYLTGAEFRQKVEAIIEAFSVMKEELEQEKRALTKIWAKREKQIERVIESTIGMHGDLQGLMGASLPEIRNLELPYKETDRQTTFDSLSNDSLSFAKRGLG